MKHKKFWKGVLSFFSAVIVAAAVNMGIKVAMEGMWLLGIPKPEAVSSVTIKHQYETEQIQEITDPKQIETCVHLTGFLKYKPFAEPEVATGKAGPLITFYYHLNSGDTVEVAANANTVFYNGKKHVLKDDDSFVNFVEGLFFHDSILYGRISEIADGNLLIEAGGKSYIIYDWMEYIPTGPSFEIGDEVEITHHGIAPEEEPAGLCGVSKIDLTHDEYVRKYGNASSVLIPYSQQLDGTWLANGIPYQYRLEITGRMGYASEDSTFVYLSNLESISFEQAYKAAGFSSNLDDYFPVEDAALVEWTLK